jgi:uncharacterized protein (TIGR02594 family)
MSYPWITEGNKFIGLKEIPGPRHNLTILNWLKELKAWWSEDETPWCGVYVAHCIKACNYQIPKYYMRAKAWSENWGVELPTATDGCIVVFDRKGGGHVGFVLGVTKDNLLAVLGGNQGNAVNIAKFDRSRVVGYYWPKEFALPNTYRTSQIDIDGGVSTNEA